MSRGKHENERDSYFLGLDQDGFPNSEEIITVYGLQGLTAIQQYEFSMDLIRLAEERQIKVRSRHGFVDFSRSISDGTDGDTSFDQLASALEAQHKLGKGKFTEIHEFAYGADNLNTLQKKKLGR